MLRALALIALTRLLTFAHAGGEESADPALDGRWDGMIQIAGTQLAITVTFTTAPILSATIDIPQQGVTGLPLAVVHRSGDALRFAIPGAGATFDGVFDGHSISGRFAQAGVTGSFELVRPAAAPVAPPEAELPYTATEAAWPLGDTTMAATLTRPAGDEPFPAVLFVAGSGPTDRDWISPLLPGTNGSAALLADVLTRAGFATLRYDKRFTGPHAAANMAALAGKVSFQTHLDELTSAVMTLLAQPGVDSTRLFVLANSEGTLHALNYQRHNPATPFAGLILTGAPGRPMVEVLHQQIAGNVLGAEPDRDALLARWDEAMAAFLAGEAADLDPALPETARQAWAGLTAPANQPFSAELLAAHPAQWLAATSAPVLVVIGQKDIQIDWRADGAVLEAAAGDNVIFRYPPNANHVLKLEERPADELTAADSVSYNAPDRVLDPEALRTILDWLAEQAG